MAFTRFLKYIEAMENSKMIAKQRKKGYYIKIGQNSIISDENGEKCIKYGEYGITQLTDTNDEVSDLPPVEDLNN